MAATTAVMMLFNQGDHVLVTDDVYGGSFRVMTKVLNRFGIDATFINTSNISEIEKEYSSRIQKRYFLNPQRIPLLK